MKIIITIIALCVLGHGQTVSVSGVITDTKAQPIAGALVKLRTLNKTVSTDDQGRYSFSISGIAGYLEKFNQYGISGHMMRVNLLTSSTVTLSLYDFSGSLHKKLYSRRHKPGSFYLSLNSGQFAAVFSESPQAGLLKLEIGNTEHFIKYSNVTSPVFSSLSHQSAAPSSAALRKNAAAWDELEASADGYITRTADVNSAAAAVDLSLAKDYRDYLSAGKKPNILLIYSDQHLGAAAGFRGHPDVLTPNIDKMAQEGVAFTRMYVQNNICASSRQSFMTGLHPRTIGQFTNSDNAPVQNRVTPMTLVFQRNGYYTYSAGKRHLLPDDVMPNNKWIDRGWDKSEGGIYREEGDGDSYVEWLMDQGMDPKRPDTSYLMEFAIDWASTSGQGPSGPGGCQYCGSKFKGERADLGTRTAVIDENYSMDAWSKNNAVREIRNRDKNKPFFIWTTYMKPHQPYNPQQKYLDLYDDRVSGFFKSWGNGLSANGSIKKPSNLEEPVGNLPPDMRGRRTNTNPIWNGGTAAQDHQIYRDYIGAYYAMITEVDTYVGELLQVLEEEGIADNTIVIYTSDHGEFAGRHGIPEKSSDAQVVYEETLNVPFIIKWPGYLTNDYTVTSLAEHLDIYPTLMSFTGLSKNGIDNNDTFPLAGKSLAPVLTEGKETGREYLVAENWKARTIITETHKMTKWYKNGETIKNPVNFNDMLFDYSEFDAGEGPAFPSETVNHITDPGYTAVKADLESKLAEWESATDATGRKQLMNQ